MTKIRKNTLQEGLDLFFLSVRPPVARSLSGACASGLLCRPSLEPWSLTIKNQSREQRDNGTVHTTPLPLFCGSQMVVLHPSSHRVPSAVGKRCWEGRWRGRRRGSLLRLPGHTGATDGGATLETVPQDFRGYWAPGVHKVDSYWGLFLGPVVAISSLCFRIVTPLGMPVSLSLIRTPIPLGWVLH